MPTFNYRAKLSGANNGIADGSVEAKDQAEAENKVRSMYEIVVSDLQVTELVPSGDPVEEDKPQVQPETEKPNA